MGSRVNAGGSTQEGRTGIGNMYVLKKTLLGISSKSIDDSNNSC